MSSIIPIHSLDSKNIIITKLKFNKATKKHSAAFLHVAGKQANLFAFETSYLSIDFPPNYYGEQNKDSIVPEEQRNYSIVFRPNGGSMEVPEQTERFMGFCEDLKNMAVDFGIENSASIFKTKFDKSQRDMMMDTSFNFPIKRKQKPDGELYPPNITVKLSKNKETSFPDCSLFIDHNGAIQQVELTSFDQFKELASKGTKCKAIVRVILSFVNKSLYFTMRLVQLKLFIVDKLSISKSYAFSDVPMTIKNSEESSEDNIGIQNEFSGETIIVESDEEVDVSDA